jgi:hypothetical protein
MLRTLLRRGFSASIFVWFAATSLVAAQSTQPSTNNPKKFIFLLPDGFKGWVCVDFGVVGSTPLPREGDALVIRPRRGGVLATSDKTPAIFLYGEAWIEANGQRKPLPNDVTVQSGPSRSGSAEPSERLCALVGTTDEREAAGDAPGFEKPSGTEKAIPPEERQALEALYRATDGDHWTHRVGWLGPPGTECNWHGVECESSNNEAARVVDLDLAENNLVGTIPQEIGNLRKLQALNLERNRLSGGIPTTLGQLGDLEWLTLFGNQLSGLVPEALIQRWLAGPLDISAETRLLTDVSEIDLESSASSVLCASHRIILNSNNNVVSYSERCRAETPDDRTTFCEVRDGRVENSEFAKLGWLVKKSGFFDLSPEYSRGIADAGFENTRVTASGGVHAVSNYAGGGPFELWTIQRAIEGVAASVEWQKTSTQQKCPRW